jgi:hypothetical protein
MATPEFESVLVRFFINKNSRETDAATITLPRLKWVWAVNRKSFELVHGMSRVAKLLPDKLATAKAIAFEEVSGKARNGTDHHFLIELINQLVEQSYLPLTEANPVPEIAPDSADHYTSGRHYLGYPDVGLYEGSLSEPPEKCKSLAQCVQLFNEQVKKVKLALNLEAFDMASLEALATADGFLSACQVYLQFVHPASVYVLRLDRFDEDLAKTELMRLHVSYGEKAYKRRHLTREYN